LRLQVLGLASGVSTGGESVEEYDAPSSTFRSAHYSVIGNTATELRANMGKFCNKRALSGRGFHNDESTRAAE